MGSNSKIFFPDLDGWRFVAFLSVFFYHGFHTEFDDIKVNPTYKFIKGLTRNGYLGVDFFFVLSGFLIIYLLISERESVGRIDIKSFYIRRILRIFPLYYLCLFVGFIIFPFLKSLLGQVPNETANWRYYVAFLANFNIIQNATLPDAGMLGVLWSVSVEEQFYLTIPFILLIAPLRFYPWIFIAFAALSIVFRLLNFDNDWVLAIHTFSFVGNLAIGGLVAYCSIKSKRFMQCIQELSAVKIKVIYLMAIAVLFFHDQLFSGTALKVLSTPIIAVIFALIILEQSYAENSFFKMRYNRLFSRLGKYTYGLYCLHILAAVIILQITSKLNFNTHLWQIIFIESPLMLGLTILMAYLSYQFYEKPFLRLKERFSFQFRKSVV